MQTKLVLKQQSALKLRFQPGATGPAGKIISVDATTLAPGSPATVVNNGTEEEAELVFGIPRGAAFTDGIAAGFPTLSDAAAATIPGFMRYFRTMRYAAARAGGGAIYARVNSEPAHPGKIRSQDRFVPDGTTSSENGGWWELDRQQVIHDMMLGVTPDGVTDNLPMLNDAVDVVDAYGGGPLMLSHGVIGVSDTWVIGDGSNTAPSSKHHRIRIVGAGRGSGPSLSNVEAAAVTSLKYIGVTDPTKAVLTLAGPLHNIQLDDFEIDCAGLAGSGCAAIHITDFYFRRICVRNFTSVAYLFSTRSGFPVGAPYGCGNGIVLDCYSYDPANNSADAVKLTSGVASSATLSGNPDTANVDFIGGVYFYGGSTGSAGIRLAGADNNTVYGSQFLPKSGNDGGGKSVLFTQWPGSPVFPHENAFYNLGKSQAVGGTSGTGGNTFVSFSESDGAPIPTLDYITTRTHTGKEYVNGARVYRVRPAAMASLNGSVQSNATTTYVNVPGLSRTVTTKAATKLRVTFNGRVAKSGSGEAFFVLALNGSAYGETLSSVPTTGYFHPLGASLILDVGAGVQTLSLQFRSSDTNAAQISNGTLIVEELY